MTKGIGELGKKTKAIDYKLAVVVSDRVNVQDVRLIETRCGQSPGANQGKHFLEIDCDTRVEVDKERKCVLVFPTFTLNGFRSESKRDEPDLTIKATFVLLYSLNSCRGLKKENYEAFADTNGIYNAWPYWREYVQSVIGRMNLPPLTIPVFRLVEPAKEGKKVKAKRRKPQTTRRQGKRRVSKAKSAVVGNHV